MSRTALVAGLVLALIICGGSARAQTPLGTAFTYQGRLVDGTAAANGAYDLEFVLFTAASGDTQVGPTVTLDDVTVAQGLFTVTPDFGAAFSNEKRFLEVGVRPGASTGAYTTLTPRQELTPGPTAIFSQAVPWSGVGSKPAGFADNQDNDAMGALTCASGQIPKLVGAAWACAADADTTYTAGAGLALAGTELSVADDGVTSAKVADGTLRGADFAPGQVVRSVNAQADGVTVAGTNGLGVTADAGVITVTSNATPAGTAGAIVSRDASGNFAAGTITASLNGNSTSATNFTGVLAGQVTGTQGATVVSNAVATNAPNAIVRRDASGDFSAGRITADLLGRALFATNFTGALAGEVTGTQTATTIPGAVAGNTPNAIVRRDATGSFAAGTTALSGSLDLPQTASATVGVVRMNGQTLLHAQGPHSLWLGIDAGNNISPGTFNNTAMGGSALAAIATGNGNSAFGHLALTSTTSGSENSAFGDDALRQLETGIFNSAFGYQALYNAQTSSNSAFGAHTLAQNLSGQDNTAVGAGALFQHSDGSFNVALGNDALGQGHHGGDNVAVGAQSLMNSDGSGNTALGRSALDSLTSGDFNVAIGFNAAQALTRGSRNIYIAANSPATESNAIRIGSSAHTATFINGISGATSASGVAVLINSSHKLGTTTSSRRYKQDIVDMGDESDALQKLRPVAFLYKPEYDETRTRQYGLIAEEVAEIAPELVVFDAAGRPETVRYHFVNAMLLNEVQKQRALLDVQESQIRDLREHLDALESLLPSVRSR